MGVNLSFKKNLTAGLVLVSLHLELEHVSAVRNQISELLNVRSLWIPLNWGSHFPVFLMTSCATTPPRKAQSLGTFRKSTSSNRFFRSWNIGNHPIENLENGRNVSNIIKKSKILPLSKSYWGQSIPLKSADALGQSPLQRLRATLLLQIALSCRTLWSQLPVQLQNYPWRLWPFLAP